MIRYNVSDVNNLEAVLYCKKQGEYNTIGGFFQQ